MTRHRILVVDDEPGMLRSVERLLQSDHRVATESNARAALELAAEFEPELALLDVRMPELNGFELAAKLREACPDLEVIFMTGSVHELDAQFIRAIREKAFYFIQKPFDRSVLLTLVDRCLELHRLAAQNREYVARLERQLDEARAFQHSMLPQAYPRAKGLALETRYRSCEAVSGDFYDFVEADGRLSFLVTDVSGHGVRAAMLLGLVKSAFHNGHGDGYAPGAIVSRISDGLASFDSDRFVTVFCGRVDARSGVLEYVNAGHPAALLWGSNRERTELGLSGPCVSPAFPDIEREESTTDIAPGDQLLVYTDGITEARTGDPNELFGRQRLLRLVTESGLSGGPLLDAILAAVDEFAAGRPAGDDQTMLSLVVG